MGWVEDMQRSACAIQDHPGNVARLRWTALRRSYSIFVRNANELLELLQRVELDPAEFFRILREGDGTETPEWQEFRAQVDQRLHNVLAGATSLVDHTRKRLEPYRDTDFHAEWTRRNDAVKDSPVASFIRRFRNVALHVHNPPYSKHVSWTAAVTKFEICMPTKILKAMCDDWPAAARAYIDSCGDRVHLRSAVQEYAGMMEQLYDWTFNQYGHLHGPELAEAQRLFEEHDARWKAGPPTRKADVGDGEHASAVDS